MIRLAKIEDVEEISAVYNESFPINVKKYSVYGQHGLSIYLKDILEAPELFPEFRLYVFVTDAGLGYGEFRRQESRGFLSNIFVSHNLRGMGVATNLITNFLSENPDVLSLELDVFESNSDAIRLYRGLGFISKEKKGWYVKAIPGLKEEHQDYILAQEPTPLGRREILKSTAMYKRYGFTEYRTKGGIDFGRLGKDVIRCYNSSDAEDPEVLMAVAQYFSEVKQAFCISAEPLDDLWLRLDVSWRMILSRQRASLEGQQ